MICFVAFNIFLRSKKNSFRCDSPLCVYYVAGKVFKSLPSHPSVGGKTATPPPPACAAASSAKQLPSDISAGVIKVNPYQLLKSFSVLYFSGFPSQHSFIPTCEAVPLVKEGDRVAIPLVSPALHSDLALLESNLASAEPKSASLTILTSYSAPLATISVGGTALSNHLSQPNMVFSLPTCVNESGNLLPLKQLPKVIVKLV